MQLVQISEGEVIVGSRGDGRGAPSLHLKLLILRHSSAAAPCMLGAQAVSSGNGDGQGSPLAGAWELAGGSIT